MSDLNGRRGGVSGGGAAGKRVLWRPRRLKVQQVNGEVDSHAGRPALSLTSPSGLPTDFSYKS